MMDRDCMNYQGMKCVRQTCTAKHNTLCCWQCVEYPDCETSCKKIRDREPVSTGGREIKIGDKISITCEIVALDNIWDYAVVKAEDESLHYFNPDNLIKIKYKRGGTDGKDTLSGQRFDAGTDKIN